MRVDKFLSDMGVASRRDCAAAVRRGGVLVGGVPIKSASVHIEPERDSVTYLGREIAYERYTYLMLNKPEGYVSATEDRRLPCVLDLLPEELRRRELFPVGRLDRDTVGLMLLTNDGALAHDLLSPRHHVAKEYFFRCESPLSPDAERRFAEGIAIGDELCRSAGLVADADRQSGVITLVEGKYHQIKRMLEAIDNRITYLERIRFGGISLDPALPRGEYRPLRADEIALLLAHRTGKNHEK